MKSAIETWCYAPFVYRGAPDNSFNECNENPNRAVTFLLNEFIGHTKMIGSYEAACNYYAAAGMTQGIKVTPQDVQDAHDIAYGDGCEHEWKED